MNTPPIVLYGGNSSEFNWEEIAGWSLQKPNKYQEIVMIDRDNEKTGISFFMLAFQRHDTWFIRFQEFNTEEARVFVRARFSNPKEDVDPRGFMITVGK